MKERDLGYFFKRGPSKTHGGHHHFSSRSPNSRNCFFPVIYCVAWSEWHPWERRRSNNLPPAELPGQRKLRRCRFHCQVQKLDDSQNTNRVLWFDSLWGYGKTMFMIIMITSQFWAGELHLSQTPCGSLSLKVEPGSIFGRWPRSSRQRCPGHQRSARPKRPFLRSQGGPIQSDCQVPHFRQATWDAWFTCRLHWKPG